MTSSLQEAISDLQSPEASVREAALDTIGSLNPPDAVTLISPFLQDSILSVRETASINLGDIDDKRAIPLLLEALGENTDDKVRYHILKALAAYHTPQILASLVEETFYGKPLRALRQAVAEQLGSYQEEIAIQALIGLLRSNDFHVLVPTVDSLARLNQPKLYDVWREIFINLSHPYISRVAATAIAELQQQTLDEFIVEASRSNDVEIRRATAYTLPLLPASAIVSERLMQLARHDSDGYVRELALISLSHYQTSEIASLVIELAQNQQDSLSEEVLESIAEQLRAYPAEKVRTALESLLHHPSKRVRLTAQDSLRALGRMTTNSLKDAPPKPNPDEV